MISVLLGAAGAIAANPTGPETMVVQQGNKVTGLVEDQMGPVAGASVVVKGTTIAGSGYCYFLCRPGHSGDHLERTIYFKCKIK